MNEQEILSKLDQIIGLLESIKANQSIQVYRGIEIQGSSEVNKAMVPTTVFESSRVIPGSIFSVDEDDIE